jgi:hypothetical protein
MEIIEDLVKNVNWNLISLDGLLDFILSESKLLLNSSELQKIVISEFSRRFKDEYLNEENNSIDPNSNNTIQKTSPRKKISSNQNNSIKHPSFTADLIIKLISNN